jgi:signal transduction histidine kinase
MGAMIVVPQWSFRHGRARLLARGEASIALIGIGMAMVLIVCLAADNWLTDQSGQDDASSIRQSDLQASGPLLSKISEQLIESGNLTELRRLTIRFGAGLGLQSCTVSIGNRKILADMHPARVNLLALPEHWTADASDPGPIDSDRINSGSVHLRFPFSVPGKGSGVIDLAGGEMKGSHHARAGVSALICAVGLCVLVFIYRRSRHALVEMEVIKGSITAMQRGETSVTALQVNSELGSTAAAWNKLLDDLENLRRRTTLSPTVTTHGNRRAGGSNLDAACDAMSQGLILVDDKMRVRFSNGAACSFMKQDRTSLAGIPAAELVQDTKFRDAIFAIAAGKLRRPVTVEIEQTAEAGLGVLRFCIRPVRRGDADSAMIIIEDITQQRTAERARNMFINQVTHELRTPLTNIRLYAETAIDDGEANPQVRANCLNVINQEARRLERIVSEMLSVAEIEAGSSTIHRDEVYFDALVHELQTDYRAQAQEKQISLEFNISPKLPKLTADKDKLTIAMHNLIGNALKYTPDGGKVTVSVDVRDGQLAIDVADTGIGIKPEESEKIFDRFFRSADPRVGKIVGTGLGLTLAREVMRLHGGDVTVQSELNRGSTFTAAMPVSMAA